MNSMYNRPLRVAVIGCGAISGNHISAILAAKQTVCALCDVDLSHAKSAAERFELGDVPLYTDYRELLEKEAPDTIHICTPHYLHAEMSVAALKKNIHVLCEKPLAISMEQLAAVRAAAKESQAQIGVCLQNRYEKNILRLYEFAQQGVSAAGSFVLWKRDKSYYDSGSWRGTWEQEGGGVMINQALHTLDMLQWMCGMPAFVTSHISIDHLKGEIEVEDTASALFETADGTRFNLFATTASGADFPIQHWLKLKNGDLVTGGNFTVTLNNQTLPPPKREEGIGKTEWGNGHKTLIADFYDCLHTDRPFPINAEEGGKVVQLILGMYTSNGERIAVPE